MEGNGCINCKFYESKCNFIKNKITLKRKCLKGNTEEMNMWWRKNGNKKPPKKLDSMPCFEETQITKSLNEMKELLDKMNNVLNK